MINLGALGLWIAFCSPAFGSGSAEKKPEAGEAAKAEGHAKEGEAPVSMEITDRYVHNWNKMPEFRAEGLGDLAGPTLISHKPGRILVLLFIASYCEPCQQLMGEFIKLQRRYQRLNTDFVFVFAHDTKDDATGFIKEFGIGSGILANFETLKAYHNPKLPTIYVGDRRGWMMKRFEESKAQDVKKLDELLKLLTSY